MSLPAKKYPPGVYFSPDGSVGKEMQEVACDLIKTERNSVITRWYRSEKDVDLYIWEDSKNNIIKQYMNICGQVIEWNIIEGVKTGFVSDEGPDGDDKEPADPLKLVARGCIQYDKSPHGAIIGQARRILHHMSVFEDQLKQDLIQNFIESPRADKMEPSEFLRIYGHNLPKDKPGGAREALTGFFKRFFGSK